MPSFQQLGQTLSAWGLQVLAAFHPNPQDLVPALANGRSAQTLLLIGNAGSPMWAAFSCSPEFADGQPDALDRWSTRVGQTLANACDGQVLFPFGGPPHHPFLTWAQRGQPLICSPLGMSLHPRYGLWHAYRFALSLPDRLSGLPSSMAEPYAPEGGCLTCVEQPCLHACPIGAFTGTSYRHGDCAQFLVANPAFECNGRGCRARRVCPVGREYVYEPAHARFHMQRFVAAHGGELPACEGSVVKAEQEYVVSGGGTVDTGL